MHRRFLLPRPSKAFTPRAHGAGRHVRRAGGALALFALLTAAAGCVGDDIGGTESDTTGSSSGDSGSGDSSTDDTTTDATTNDDTTTDDSTTDDTTTDDYDTTTGEPPNLPDGQCWSEFHGTYWCECNSAGNTEECDGGVSTCFEENATVITHTRWGPCGSCAPGEELPCDVDGVPGRVFCNVVDASVNDIDNLPTPEWGICVVSDFIVCEPGESQATCDGGFYQHCELDLDGVPYWTECL